MEALHRHCVLVLALIAAAMILGGRRARAGYISPAEMAERDGVKLLALSTDFAAPDNMAGTGETLLPHPDTDGPHAPSGLFTLLRQLSFAASVILHSRGAGGSSQSVSPNGPSNSPGGYLTRSQVPPPELSGLLPPPTGAVHPLFLISSIFHPPRAA